MNSDETKSAPYEVGYGKPPRHTRFRKGQSGNPGGRPRATPTERAKALALHEAYRTIIVHEDGIAVPVTAIQAVLRNQLRLAANGNLQAQLAVLAAIQTIERENVFERNAPPSRRLSRITRRRRARRQNTASWRRLEGRASPSIEQGASCWAGPGNGTLLPRPPTRQLLPGESVVVAHSEPLREGDFPCSAQKIRCSVRNRESSVTP